MKTTPVLFASLLALGTFTILDAGASPPVTIFADHINLDDGFGTTAEIYPASWQTNNIGGLNFQSGKLIVGNDVFGVEINGLTKIGPTAVLSSTVGSIADNTSKTVASISLPTNGYSAALTIEYAIYACNSANIQQEWGEVKCGVVNHQGTLICTVLESDNKVQQISTGSLTSLWEFTAVGTTASLRLTANTSLNTNNMQLDCIYTWPSAVAGAGWELLP